MNKKLGAVILIIILLLLNVEAGSAINKNISNDKEKEWTYMVFAGGDDLKNPMLSLDPFIDLLMNISIPFNGKINIVCLYDGNCAENGTAFYGRLKRVGLFRAKLEIVEEYEELNFLNYTTLRDFIIRCKAEYPANRYFLHIHSHGWAWAGAIHDQVTDEGKNSLKKALTMNEIHKALDESGGVDILEFSSCYMGSFESAYELRNCTDFYIGSEEKSEISMAFYTFLNDLRILQRYSYMPSEIIVKKLVNRFRISHPYRFTPFDIVLGLLSSLTNGQRLVSNYYYNHPSIDSTLSAVRTDKLDDVCEAIDNLSELFIENLDAYRDIITAARIQSEDFPGFYLPIGKMVDIYDFADLLIKNNFKKLNPELHNISQEIKNSLEEAIIANWAQIGHKNAHGLSLFFPHSHNFSYDLPHWDMQNYTTHKLEFKDNTCWDEFLGNYLDN